MPHGIEHLLAGVLAIVWAIWQMRHVLAKGRVGGNKLGMLVRSENPRLFWFYLCWWSFLILAGAYLAIGGFGEIYVADSHRW